MLEKLLINLFGNNQSGATNSTSFHKSQREIACEGSLPLNFSTNSGLTFFNIIHLAFLKNLSIIVYKKMRYTD